MGASSTVSDGKTATSGNSKGKQKSSNKQKPTTYVHVAISEDVLGVLFATDLVRHQTHFESRRREHKYYLRLRPHNTNHFQLPYALDAIDYFFRDLDLSFIVSLPKPKVKKQASSKDIASDLTDVQMLEQRLLQLIRTGLALRAEGGTVAAGESYIDIVCPGLKTRDALKKYVLHHITGLSYLPAQVVNNFPPQQLPENVPTKKGRIRKALNNTAEVAEFLTGYAGSFLRETTNTTRVRVRKALAAKLEIDGHSLKPLEIDSLKLLEKNKKFRVVWTIV